MEGVHFGRFDLDSNLLSIFSFHFSIEINQTPDYGTHQANSTGKYKNKSKLFAHLISPLTAPPPFLLLSV